MSEDTWLELTLSFVTNEEKQTLQVPARDRRPEIVGGYGVAQLQQALVQFDPSTFKPFRLANCRDPVALRVIEIDRLTIAEKKKPPPRKEVHLITKPSDKKPSDKKPAALPTKDGAPDQAIYAKFATGSLRRRVWDAMVASKCPRCNEDHLRVACPKPRQAWEDDFEKPDFFTRTFTKPKEAKKTVRVQISRPLDGRLSSVLWVTCALGPCLIDTGSDISLARRDVLVRLCSSSIPVSVSHLGGETIFEEMGALHLDGVPSALNSDCLLGVIAVDGSLLPDGVVALLGLPDILALRLSVDYVIAHRGCDWRLACPSSFWDSCLCFLRLRRRKAASDRTFEALPLLERTLSQPSPPVPAIHDPPGSCSNNAPPGRGLPPSTKRDKIGHPFSIARKHPAPELLEEIEARRGKTVPFAPSSTDVKRRSPYRYQRVNASEAFMAVPYGDRDIDHRGKWYAIRRGRQIGVFSSWAECESLVKGFHRAEYKSFWTLEEARSWVLDGKAAAMGVQLKHCRMQTSSFVGGKALRAWIDVLDGSSEDLQVYGGLDSGADVNLAFRSLLHDVHPIGKGEVFNCGQKTSFVEEGTLLVSIKGEIIGVPALAATKAQLPHRCQVLLGMPGLDSLGVMLDAHRESKHLPLECFVGERTLRTWLETNGGKTVTSVPSSIAEVQINPDLPAEMQERVRQLLVQYENVFAGELDTLPKPFAAEPVALKFVENPIAQSVPEPRWTLAQRQILTQWAEEGLKNGSLELSTSRWASRPHIVMKTPANTHKDLIDVGKCKLRVCGDYRLVNQQIVKIVPNLPTGLEEVEKAAGHRWYWETDAQACYSQFVLSPGLSREALAVWSPIGLVQPTTLPFGQKNSGTEAQGPYRAAASELSKGRHGNYVDDWIGYSNSLSQLFDDFEVFLKVCVKYNITLGPHKTRFGFPEAQFFGFRVNAEGSHLALKHLDPIRQMVPPSDIHELRRVLGLFVVSRKYIRNFAIITKPMTDILRGKHPVFSWMEPQQKAFDFVRDKLLAGVHLAAPDFELPFHLATDASEDGKGGELYQLPSVPIESQFPYDAKLHAPENHAVIFFISKAFNETQRLKPPFYLEGDSLLWGTDKSRYYALSSKYPLYTYSDHMPLNWMHKTEKGPISSFIIERLADIETIHQYIQGKLNTLADSCSRFPMLGPRDLAPRGYTHSVEELLRRLPASLREATLVHFHGGRNHAELRATLKLWVRHVSSLQPVTPPREGSPLKADVAILTPRSETTPVSLALYLLSDVPFALLMPVDLLAQARQPNLCPGCPHEIVAERLAKAGKITILDAQMVWVIGNVDGCCPVEIFSAQLRTPAPLTGFARPAPGPPGDVLDDLADAEGTVPRTLEAWTRAQQDDPDFPTLLEQMEHKAQRQNLWINAPPDHPPTIIVPLTCSELLVRDTHERMFHLSQTKVFALLRRSYSWPTMRKDVRKILSDCPACELTKARQNTAHGLFSAMPVHAPRSRWCMDFQGQGKALTGETEALALIDPTSRYVVVIPLMNREAKTWLQPFLDRIVFTFGAPNTLHSDAAPEFLSEALELLAQAADIRTTTTLGHNARGNGTIEVFWRFWNRCLRLLPDDHYVQWPSFAQRIAFAYNSAIHDSLDGPSPFEVYHGSPANNPLAALLVDSPQVDEDQEMVLPAQFAEAVATSTRIFSQLAKTHDQFVREETAARLNEHGSSRTFLIGQKVKISVPPTAEQMEQTGRRAKHITAWRGPCTVVERLSSTSYSVIDETTQRTYERVASNMLSYRAALPKTNASARQYNATYSEPFLEGEFVAIRDSPTGPFYVAQIQDANPKSIRVHYHGTTHMVLSDAVFKPCWHAAGSEDIVLSWNVPDDGEWQHLEFIDYHGIIDLKDIHTVLVARNLEFTKTGKLRFRSLRALAPFHDQLFRFTK